MYKRLYEEELKSRIGGTLPKENKIIATTGNIHTETNLQVDIYFECPRDIPIEIYLSMRDFSAHVED